jgi:serine/threonine protein kinase
VGVAPAAKKGKPQKLAKPRIQAISVQPELVARRITLNSRFTFKLGDRIGKDLTVIGHLGMGRISELYQVWSSSYTCALTCKILLPIFARDSKELRGFQREAGLLKRMAHPRIMRVFEEGSDDGREYLVQDYLQGPSLFPHVAGSGGHP